MEAEGTGGAVDSQEPLESLGWMLDFSFPKRRDFDRSVSRCFLADVFQTSLHINVY